MPTANILSDTSPAAAYPALTVGMRVRIEKGCVAREVVKGTDAEIADVKPMGADYGHCVRVQLHFLNGYKAGKSIAFFARHANRLSDAIISMNDGNPLHKIELRRLAPRPAKAPSIVAAPAPAPAPMATPFPVPEAPAANGPIEIHAFMEQANGGRLRSFEFGGFKVMVQAHEDDASQAAFVAKLAAFCEGQK